MSYMDHLDVPAEMSYMTLNKGQHHRTVEFGQKITADNGEEYMMPDILIDLAEDGSVIGVEFLRPGRLTWDVVCMGRTIEEVHVTAGAQVWCDQCSKSVLCSENHEHGEEPHGES